MDSLLIAGTSAVGLAVGAVLDPVGRRLADRSRATEARRAAEKSRAAESAGAPHAVDPEADRAPAPARVPVSADEVRGAGEGPPPEGPPAGAGTDAAREGTDLPVSGRAAGDGAPQWAPAEPSPVRPAAAAVLTGLLFGGAAAEFGAHLVLVPFCVFFAMLVAVSATDLSHRLVPRRLVYGALILIVPFLVLTSAVDTSFSDLGGAAVAGAVSFGVFFALWWFVPRGMGFGDVRLAGAIGLTVGYLSLLHAYVAFLAGFVIGMMFGLVTMAVSGTGRRTRIPFAPSLAAGAAIGVFWGAPLAHHLFHAT